MVKYECKYTPPDSDLVVGQVYDNEWDHKDPAEMLRVTDKSGENYLYPLEWFRPVIKPWPDEAVAIICTHPDDPQRRVIPGSKLVECWQCARPVTLSPATEGQMKTLPAVCIICPECARAYCILSGQKLWALPQSREQKAELV